MNIYQGLLFLHGHLTDVQLVDSLAGGPERTAVGPAPARAAPKARVPLAVVQPRRRARVAAPLRALGDCG